MQATAESMHRVALATMPRPSRSAAPPDGMPQDGMRVCKTCGAGCYGEQCRPCWDKANHVAHAPKYPVASRCEDCGKHCTGSRCRTCWFQARREGKVANRPAAKPLPVCAEPGCGKQLSTRLSVRCAKHAARLRIRPERPERPKPVRLRQCQPGNNLHAITGKDATDTYVCTCGAFRAIALAVPA